MVLLFGPLVLRNGDSQLEGIFGEKGLIILSHRFKKPKATYFNKGLF